MKGKLPNLSGMIRYYGYRFKQWRDNTLKEIKSPNNTTMLVAVLLLSFAFSLTVVFFGWSVYAVAAATDAHCQ